MRKNKGTPLWRRIVLLSIILIISFAVSKIDFPGLSQSGKIMLGIFVFAALSWITEVIPLAATAAAIVFFESLFLSRVSGLENGHKIWMSSFASTTIVLFAGGFFLAVALKKYGIDIRIARAIMKKVGHKPPLIILGMICITGFLSMWISNTATTALMMAVIIPIANRMESSHKFVKGLILSIPFAANIGGIATPVGTPPNAIAISNLAAAGIKITFTSWVKIGFPIAILLLLILWRLLLHFFPPDKKTYSVEFPEPPEFNSRSKVVVFVFIFTALMWLLESLHGISASIIAMFPPIFLVGFGLIGKKEIREIGWETLILVGGGIALGTAMQRSGLSQWFIGLLPFSNSSSIFVMLTFASLTYIASNFMSHSAASNMMIPIILGLSSSTDIVSIAISAAICSSCAMILPISTPPNAIAYASEKIDKRNMARVGIIIGVIGLVFVNLLMYIVSNYLNVG